jgi:hypothetical protein
LEFHFRFRLQPESLPKVFGYGDLTAFAYFHILEYELNCIQIEDRLEQATLLIGLANAFSPRPGSRTPSRSHRRARRSSGLKGCAD